jgi:hypothetical protein
MIDMVLELPPQTRVFKSTYCEGWPEVADGAASQSAAFSALFITKP